MDDAQLTLALQILLSQNKLVEESKAAYEAVRKIFSEPIPLRIEGDTNFGQALSAIRQFSQAVEKLSGQVEHVQAEMEEPIKATAIQKITEDVDELAAKLKKAIAERDRLESEYSAKVSLGFDTEKISDEYFKAEEAVEELTKRLQELKATSGSAIKDAGQAAKQTAKEVKKAVTSVGKDPAAGGIRVTVSAEHVIEQIRAALASKEFELRIDQASLAKQISSSFSKVDYSALTQGLKTASASTKKMMAGAVAPLASFNPTQFTAAIQQAVASLQQDDATKLKFDVHRTYLRDQIAQVARDDKGMLPKIRLGVHQPFFITSVIQAIQAAEQAIGDGKIKVGLHMTHLRDQISHVLRNDNNRLARLRIGINQPYFISSLYEAIQAAEKANLKVNVTATVEALSREAREMAAKAAEAAARATKAANSIDSDARRAARRERRLRERDEERKGIISRQRATLIARTDPLGFLQKRAPHLVPLAQKLVEWTRPDLSDDERKAAIIAANEVKDEFRRALADMEFSVLPRDQKEELLRFGTAFRAQYITELDRKERQHTGRLAASAQQQILDDLLRDQYLEHIRKTDEQLRDFSGFRTDLGGEFRNRFQEQQNAYRRRIEEIRRWEREMLGWTTAREDKERKIAEQRVQSARRSLENAEREYKYRLLRTQGNIVTPNVTLSPDGSYAIAGGQVQMSKAEAAIRIEEALRREFGPAFQEVQRRVDRFRSILISRGRADEAMALPERTFAGFIEQIQSGNRAAVDLYLRTKGVTEEILKDEQRRAAAIRQYLDPLRQVFDVERRLTQEMREQHRIQDALARYRQARAHRQANPGEFARTLRGASYLVGGYAVGMAAAFQVRDAFRVMVEFEQIIRDIQGVLSSKSFYDAQRIAQGVADTARKYGADLLETARAAKILAQTGLSAAEVVRELDYTMLAMRGMGMTIEQMQELQIAVRAMADESERALATVSVLEKISEVEAQYAVTAQDLAESIQALSPVMKQFEHDVAGIGNAMDYTIGLTTVMVEKLRVTGSQAANAVKFMLSRIVRPEILRSLQEDFGVQLATPDGKDFLPLPDLLATLAERYQQLNVQDPARAKQFAVQLAGGRQYNLIVAALQDFARVQDIATRSSFAFGSAQQRAQIALDTLDARLERLRANFRLFTKNILESSGATDGLKAATDALASVLGGVSGQGAGFFTSLLMILGLGAVARGGKAAYRFLDAASLVGGDAFAVVMAERRERQDIARAKVAAQATTRLGQAVRFTSRGIGFLASIFSTPGLLISGLLLGISVIGKLSKAFAKGGEEVDKYTVRLRSLQDLRVFEAPQFQRFERMASDYGFGTAAKAYDVVEGLIGRGTGPNVEALLRQRGIADVALPRHQQMKQVAEFLNQPANTEFLRTFRKEFVDAFVKDLPQAGEKLKGITNEAERIAVVTQLIGHAAWAASFQIEQALTAMRENTNRLLSDVMLGLDALDKSQRKGWLQKLGGWATDVFAGRTLVDERIELNPRAIQRLSASGKALDVLRDAGLPNDIVQLIAGVNELSDSFQKLKEEALASGRQFITTAELLNRHFERLRNTTDKLSGGTRTEYDRLVSQAADRILAMSGVPELELAAATSNAGQRTEPELLRENIMKFLRDAQAIAMQRAEEILGANHPELQALREAYNLLIRSGERGALALNNLSEASFKLKDRLLDMIISIEEAFARLRIEEELSRDYGFRFDRGSELTRLGQQMLMDLRMLPLRNEFDIVRAQNQLRRAGLSEAIEDNLPDDVKRRLATVAVEGVDLEALSGQKNSRAQQLLRDIAAWREQRDLLQKVAKEIESIFPKEEEGRRLLEQFRQDFKAAFEVDDRATLGQVLERALRSLIEQGRALTLEHGRQVQALEMQGMAYQKVAELQQRQLEGETSLARRIEGRERISRDLLAVQIAMVREKIRLNEIDQVEGQLQIERLTTEHAINMAFERRAELLQAQLGLDQQIRSNIKNSLSGLTSVLKDLSVWQRTGEEIAVALLTPIGQTFHERVVENLTASLAEVAGENEMLRNMFGGPEIRLRREIEVASQFAGTTFSNSILTASQEGAQSFYFWIKQALAEAGVASPVSAVSAVTDEGLQKMESATVRSILTKNRGTGVAAKNVPTLSAKLLGVGTQLANLAGTLGGTMLGNAVGGAYGSLGASLGTMLGQTLIPIPVVGGLLGGLAGGLLGGLFGKKKEQRERQTVASLQAIERAQRETVETIKAQTDALLSPGNRLLNRPSTFNVPAYRPDLSGSAAGLAMVVNNNQTITIEVNASGMSESEARRMVSDAVADALMGGRRNRGKNVSNV